MGGLDRKNRGAEPESPAPPPATEQGAVRESSRDGVDARVRELLETGDLDRAATAAIKQYGPPVHRFLRSLLRDEDGAADAHSEWSERLWRALPGFRWGCSLGTWAFKIAWNVAQNAREEAWRRRRRRLPTGAASLLAAEIRTKSPRTVERRWRGLEKLRAKVPIGDQSLLNLRFEQALSWAEVGEILGAHPDAVMQRYKRLKDRLRRMARDEGLLE